MFMPYRRSFLLGSAGIITTSFVARTQDWIGENERPLFLPPRPARQALWVNYFDDQIQFSLGNPDVPEPDPPSWADYFRLKGHALDMSPEARRLMAGWDLLPSDLRNRWTDTLGRLSGNAIMGRQPGPSRSCMSLTSVPVTDRDNGSAS